MRREEEGGQLSARRMEREKGGGQMLTLSLDHTRGGQQGKARGSDLGDAREGSVTISLTLREDER